MSRFEEFKEFGKDKPSFATAREIVNKSIPMDIGYEEEYEGNRRTRLKPLGTGWGNEGHNDTPEAVLERKYQQAKDRGIAEDIRKRGVLHPIRMISNGAYLPETHVPEGTDMDEATVPLVYNGQHRLAVMFHEFPDTPIPIEWDKQDSDWQNEKKNVKYNRIFPPKKGTK
jgi:hypothetical protein